MHDDSKTTPKSLYFAYIVGDKDRWYDHFTIKTIRLTAINDNTPFL